MTYFILTLDHMTVLYEIDGSIQVTEEKEKSRVVINNATSMKTTCFGVTQVNVVDWFMKTSSNYNLSFAYQLSEETYYKILNEQLSNSVEKVHNYYDRTQPDDELL